MDKLNEMDKRLIRVETRMDDFDKRLVELREDMNKRFEQVDKRFEQVDKRFEQVDKRFEQMLGFMGILATIFTTMTLGTIGFAVWDRRSLVKPFEYKVKEIEDKIELKSKDIAGNSARLDKLIEVVNKYSEKNKDFGELLHKSGII